MKYKFTLSIGLQGKREEIVEIPDEDMKDLNDVEKQKFLEEQWLNWSQMFIDGGWYEYE